jgi:hypothetical protein
MNWRHRRAEFRDACRTARQILTEWDPAGFGGGVPADEYDCLVHFVVSRLNAGADEATLGEQLRHQVGVHFGVPAVALDADAVAARLVAWWATLTPTEPGHRSTNPSMVRATRAVGDTRHTAADPLDTMNDYAYLWDGTDPGWVVLGDPDRPDNQDLPFNRRTGMAMVICEDDDLSGAVLCAMRAHGLPVVPPESLRENSDHGPS